MKALQVLVVEDDMDILNLIEFHLSKEGYIVHKATRGTEALAIMNDETLDMAILDVMLPEIPGTELCRRMKTDERMKNIPVLFVTARDDVHDKLIGFNAGADDYITKPFSPQEMVARVKAVAKRSIQSETRFEVGDFSVHFDSHSVQVGNKRVHLRPREFKVLQLLIERKNKTLSRNFLLERAWGMDSVSGTRSVDIVITRLREKIEDYGKCIRTVTGFGYQWDEAVFTEAGTANSSVERE